jgi:transposase
MNAAVVDLGQVRGLALFRARGTRIRHIAADAYSVPSASGRGGYVVDVAKKTCTCPAHEESGASCKHMWAVAYSRRDRELPLSVVESEVSEAVRRIYTQNARAYDNAQCEEEERVQILLRALCDGIAEKPRGGRGRPRAALGDLVYCATLKVYGLMSGRRSSTEMRAAVARGHIKRAPAFNSLFRFMERADTTPLLKMLVQESAKPFREIEHSFAVDSTGFSTNTYVRYFDYAHGEDRSVQRWVKGHVMVGTMTHIIVSVNVTTNEGPGSGDAPNLPELVQQAAANGFDVREVSADKAYLSHENLAVIEAVGAQPYIPFKSNNNPSGSPAWNRMYHLFSLNPDVFKINYHKRSAVEASFSAKKRKFGSSLRSKTRTAQFNEVLLKCLCFNLSCIVHAIHELDLAPEFWTPAAEVKS